ncbi:MAG: response regulator [Nitrospirales bacterium]|nr:response regulator [Nitrospirales bacterium]
MDKAILAYTNLTGAILPSSGLNSNSRQTKILMVDDESNILKLYRTEISDMGYHVINAMSGEEALYILEKETPDLITLDIMMPGMDGFTTLRKIKDLNKNIPVIMLTAFDYRYEFAVQEADGYVEKSSDTTKLRKTIANLLKKGASWDKCH